MPQVGFEPTISRDERPKTYALDRAATGTGAICTVATEYVYRVNQVAHYITLKYRRIILSHNQQHHNQYTHKMH